MVLEAEGLKLHLNPACSTGYRGVTFSEFNSASGFKKNKPFKVTLPGKVFVGYFATVVEAAVCYAQRCVQQEQHRQPEAMEEEDDDEEVEDEDEDEDEDELAAEQAVDADEDGQGEGRGAAEGTVLEVEGPNGIVLEAEGMKLHLNPRATSGYRGVTFLGDGGAKPFRAISCGVYVGRFATVVEAAVNVARHVQQKQPEMMEEKQEEEVEAEQAEEEEEEAAEAEAEDRQRELRVGDAVEGQYGTDSTELWWPGTVTRVWRGGNVDVRYDDGDTELRKLPSRVRRLQLHRSSNSSSGYKGVYRNKRGLFEAKYAAHRKLHCLGTFGTALEAAEAYARSVALEQEAEEAEEEEAAEAAEAAAAEARAVMARLLVARRYWAFATGLGAWRVSPGSRV